MTLFRLTAVTAQGSGFTRSWGDTYEVEAESYDAAEADVLGREGVPGTQPYDHLVNAWRWDGWQWRTVELPSHSTGELPPMTSAKASCVPECPGDPEASPLPGVP